MATAQYEYSFPDLKPHELLAALQSLLPELHIVKADLRNPQTDRLIAIYQSFLRLLYFDENSFHQPTLQSLENIECIEMYEDALPLLIFSKTLSYVLKKIFYYDFHTGDILHPDEKRTRRILSALCNFVCFVEDNKHEYENVFREAEVENERKKNLSAKNDELKKKLESLMKEKAEKESAGLSKKALLDEKRKKMKLKQEEKVKLVKTYDDYKAKGDEFEKKLVDLSDATRKAKLENDIVSQKLIKSPERLVEKVKIDEKELEQMEKVKVEKTNRHVELQHQLEKCKSWSLDVGHLVQCVSDLGVDVNKQNQLKADIKKADNKKVRLASSLKAIDSKQTELDMQLKNRQQQKDQMEMQHRAKLASINATTENLKKAIAQKEAAKTKDELLKIDLRNKTEKLMEEMDLNAKNTQAHIRMRKKQIEELEEDTRKNFEALHKALERNKERAEALKSFNF